MSAEHIHNFYLCLGNSPLAAALLALSFAEGPSYNGFVLAAVRGKTPSTYAADSGSGWVGKRPFGAELRINGDDEEKSAKRPPIYALSLLCLSNCFGHHPPLSFGLRWLFAACLHSVPALPFALAELRLFLFCCRKFLLMKSKSTSAHKAICDVRRWKGCKRIKRLKYI